MSPNPEQLYSRRQHFVRLLSAIDNLAPNLRVVARARVLQERSVSETAELLDISEAAIKSRTLRARVRLASKLTPGAKSLNEVFDTSPIYSETALVHRAGLYVTINALDTPARFLKQIGASMNSFSTFIRKIVHA
ncbi:RNA polymerase sigma factor [Acidicapsa acidisoli]|uniref:RNA polymerase sigma factor n=1 Tax=Acidicapsa acidisoli TaxID=1615681 RepID=UPI0037BED4AA